MPHIIVEYSANIEGVVAIPDMLVEMHEALAAQGVDKARIKTRGVSIPHSVVGDVAPNAGHMVHITLLLLEGRDDATKKQYSAPIYAAAQKAVSNKFPNCAVTLDVRDMNAATYTL